MRTMQIFGLILWRGGLLLAGGYALYYGARYALRLCRWFGLEIPLVVEIALGLFLGGFLLVLGSVILERIHDIRHEKKEGL